MLRSYQTSGPDAAPPAGIELLGLVVIGEQLRPEARATVEFFRRAGSRAEGHLGRRPETVAAIAREAGIAVDGDALDGRDLDSTQALAASVIGRITPEGKRSVVEALRARGRYVAMVGDGVNDVPALKASRLAIAQGSGTQMARSVADLVLVGGDFAAVPPMVDEGRKILRNLAAGRQAVRDEVRVRDLPDPLDRAHDTAYPLLPRHLTLAAALTIGIPAFFLALAPSSGAFGIKGLLSSTSRVSPFPPGSRRPRRPLQLPVRARRPRLPLVEARTVATTTLVLVGLYLIFVLEARGRLTRRISVLGLCLAMLGLYALVLIAPSGRNFFDLALGPALPASFAGAALAAVLLWLTDDRFVPATNSARPPAKAPDPATPASLSEAGLGADCGGDSCIAACLLWPTEPRARIAGESHPQPNVRRGRCQEVAAHGVTPPLAAGMNANGVVVLAASVVELPTLDVDRPAGEEVVAAAVVEVQVCVDDDVDAGEVEVLLTQWTEAGIEVGHRRVQLRHAGVDQHARIGMVDDVHVDRHPLALGEQVGNADWRDRDRGGGVHCVPTAAVVVDM